MRSSDIKTMAFPRTGKRGVPQQFPRRLYEMLESETKNPTISHPTEQDNIIIAWSESGRAFRIADVSLFATQVLPKYFRTAKFSSFQRNLNLYGFSKVRRGPDSDMYAHPAFIRGRPDCLSRLKKCTNAADRRRLAESVKVTQENPQSGTIEYSDQDQAPIRQWQSTPSSPSYSTDDSYLSDSNSLQAPQSQGSCYINNEGIANYFRFGDLAAPTFNIMRECTSQEKNYLRVPQEAIEQKAAATTAIPVGSGGVLPHAGTNRLSLLALAVSTMVQMESSAFQASSRSLLHGI